MNSENKQHKSERERFLEKYGWMVENLRRFQNTLIAKHALKEYGKEKIISWISQEIGQPIEIVDYDDFEVGEKDCIAIVSEKRTVQ